MKSLKKRAKQRKFFKDVEKGKKKSNRKFLNNELNNILTT